MGKTFAMIFSFHFESNFKKKTKEKKRKGNLMSKWCYSETVEILELVVRMIFDPSYVELILPKNSSNVSKLLFQLIPMCRPSLYAYPFSEIEIFTSCTYSLNFVAMASSQSYPLCWLVIYLTLEFEHLTLEINTLLFLMKSWACWA